MEHDFRLRFRLQPADADMDALVERLYEAGCDDALVGIGVPGRLALDFTREADSATATYSCLTPRIREDRPAFRLF